MHITKITDLIPDVMFRVKRADEISVRHALTLTVENLAHNHEFFTEEVVLPRYSDLADVRNAIGNDRFLRLMHWREHKDDKLAIAVCSVMPNVDEPVWDTDYLTKWRRLIIAGAVAELLLQTGEVWANPDRGAFLAREFNEDLESWKVAERVSQGGITPVIQDNPWAIL